MLQIVDGQLEVDYGAGWKTIKNGFVHVLPPGYKHRFRAVSDSWQFGLDFTVEADDRGLLDALRRAFPVPAIQPMFFHESWKEMFIADLSLGYTAKLRALHALEDWTISLVEMKDKSSGDPEAIRLAELLKAWNRRFVNVSDIARELCWSRTKTELICKRRFGCGIMKLHEKMRMEEASRLLLNTGLSVGKVADQCGYADIYGFSRAFTRIVGVSPSTFRRKIREG